MLTDVAMLTDAELVDGVVAGYDDAFAQLYERHSLAAWRLGQTVTGNADDAADAVSEAFARVLVAVRAGHLDKGGSFRSYLLTATRNAALDNIRKTSRSRPTEHDHLSEVESTSPTPSEHLSHDEEAALVAEAFRNLPERWRSILWLTEVEGVATKDAAQRLGLSPNGAAQLAVRARTGLRERFLQAHLGKSVDPGCRTTVDRLGAYVGGGLSPRDLAKVDQHLAGCASCEARRKELEEVGTCLRRAALPVPLALAGGLGAAGAPGLFGLGAKVAKAASWAQQAWAQKAAAAAAAGIIAVGAGGAYVTGSDPEPAAPEATEVVVGDDQAESGLGAAFPEGTPPPEATGPAPAPGDPSTPPPPAPLPVEPGTDAPAGECASARIEVGPAGAGPVPAEVSGPPPAGFAPPEGGGAPPAARPEGRVEVDSVLGADRHERPREEEPSLEAEAELSLADLAARLALAAEMAGRGLHVDLDVADRPAAPGDCAAGLQAGIGGGGDAPATELDAQLPG